jgi:hypothetical protein
MSNIAMASSASPSPQATAEAVEFLRGSVLQIGLNHARNELRGQPGLTAQDYYLLDMVLEKGGISDATITLAELERLKAETSHEIMPSLAKLVQYDLLKRLPTERATEYAPMPLMEGECSETLSPESSEQGSA